MFFKEIRKKRRKKAVFLPALNSYTIYSVNIFRPHKISPVKCGRGLAVNLIKSRENREWRRKRGQREKKGKERKKRGQREKKEKSGKIRAAPKKGEMVKKRENEKTCGYEIPYPHAVLYTERKIILCRQVFCNLRVFL